MGSGAEREGEGRLEKGGGEKQTSRGWREAGEEERRGSECGSKANHASGAPASVTTTTRRGLAGWRKRNGKAGAREGGRRTTGRLGAEEVGGARRVKLAARWVPPASSIG